MNASPYLPRDDAEPTLYSRTISLLNKTIGDPRTRDSIAAAIASSVNSAVPPDLRPTRQDSPQARQLQEMGLLQFAQPPLAPEALAAAAAHFEKCKPSLIEGDLEYFSAEDIFDAPHLLELILHPTILGFVREYLGAPPTITDVAAWWTNPRTAEVAGAQIFHRDRGGLKTCKIFLYLTEVGVDNGPHEYVTGSGNIAVTADWFRSRGVADDMVMRVFDGNARGIANEVTALFGERVVTLTGPAGTCFITNNFGLHRGQPVTKGRRLLYEALYSVSALPERKGVLKCHNMERVLQRVPANDGLARFALRLLEQGKSVPSGGMTQ